MICIIGCVVVLGSILTGFTMAGGHIGALIHPSEFVTIGGAAFGALIIMAPKKVLIDMFKGVIQCFKGSPYNKAAYGDLFKLLYDLFRLARREGLIILESHLTSPHESTIFTKYQKVLSNHHAIEFICGSLSPVLDGTVKSEQMAGMLKGEINLISEEHHSAMMVLSKTADGLPGFGIVAAVMGIVVTMGAINGPVEEIGEKVGAALVGTFLGILLSYGFCGPFATQLEFLAEAEIMYFRAVATAIQGFVNDLAPKEALEQARRSVGGEMRFSREALDELFKEVEKT